MSTASDDFTRALLAGGPKHPARIRNLGKLVGSWEVHGQRLDETTGEWADRDFTFIVSWVLEGRAIQDLEVVHLPDGSQRTVAMGVRVYDPATGLVRVSYFSPEADQYCQLVASTWKSGVRQDGTQNDGRPIRWNFSDITADSYTWEGWVSDDDGATWHLVEHNEGIRLA